MNIYETLGAIQSELKAPKNKYNKFGKYYYRNCEGILEGVKPLLKKYGASLRLTDDIVSVSDRVYVKATAIFRVGDEEVTNTAFAREDAVKKGMDGSQVTGTASSYARKYALNGLLLIDDTKDADTDENHVEAEARAAEEAGQAELDANLANKISKKDATILEKILSPEQKAYVLKGYKVKTLTDLTVKQSGDIKTWLMKMKEKAENG